jgi:hypothetical protein
LALLAVDGCRTAAPVPNARPVTRGDEIGAPDATSAVREFLDAAKQQDLQAMSALFGDKDGLARDRLPREETEKREIIMACYLKHDSYDLVGDAPSLGDARVIAVKLTLGPITRATNFQVDRAGNRWFVHMFDPAPLQDLCAYRPSGG